MTDQGLTDCRILVVDDNQGNVALLQALLEQWDYTKVSSTTDSSSAVSLFEQTKPDLLILDLQMPPPDGFAIMKMLAPLSDGGVQVPILVLTADITVDAKQRALSMGATDFLTKPFDPTEVRLRVQNLLKTRRLQLALKDHNDILEQRVRERTAALERSELELLERLAIAAGFRDDETEEHTHRVGLTSSLLAEQLGLPAATVRLVGLAAPLHDIGKIGVPDDILLKPGKLTAEEFAVMQTHVTIGASILSQSPSPLLRLGEEIALTHHERWDGTGYPSGAKGEEIPVTGRIVAIADVYDALTHDRPYKDAWPVDEAVEEIRRQSGRQFDPRVVEAFEALDHEALVQPVPREGSTTSHAGQNPLAGNGRAPAGSNGRAGARSNGRASHGSAPGATSRPARAVP